MSSHSQNNSDDSSESQPTAGTETVPSGANQDAPSYSHVLAQEELATLEPDDCRTHGANALIEDDDVGTGNEDRRSEETSSGHVYVGSLEVEDYWILIRRFNKQVFHVKKTKTRPRGDLDMHIAADEDITSEKLQAHAERLYMVVITRLLTSYKQLVRLRSWKERPRTLCFLGAYTIAWLADLLLPAMVLFVIILIAYPSARATCFPAAPASLTNYATGAVQKPFAGVLASDSVTGAPEKHRGEAVEQEASSFFTSIGTLLLGIGSGEYSKEKQGEVVAGPKRMARDLADVGNVSSENSADKNDDRTKEPVSRAVDSFQARPVLHVLPDFVDTFERLENALSPTAPFPRNRPRLVLASCLLPTLVLSCVLGSYSIMKGFGLALGFGLFGRPVVEYAVSVVDKTCPRWREYTELRNTLLKGVPTNAQLAATLLRSGEANDAAFPSPPATSEPPHVKAGFEAQSLAHLGASETEIQAAISPVSDEEYAKLSEATEKQEQSKPSTTHRVADRIKQTVKSSVQAVHKVGYVKDALKPDTLHNHHRVKHKQSISKPTEDSSGPVRFSCRYNGHRGHAFITKLATTPAVSWVDEKNVLDSSWTLAIGDIKEVRKIGGEDRKRRALADWALDREVDGGVELRTETDGEFCLTAVSSRDDLFNRIITIGSQMWEIW